PAQGRRCQGGRGAGARDIDPGRSRGIDRSRARCREPRTARAYRKTARQSAAEQVAANILENEERPRRQVGRPETVLSSDYGTEHFRVGRTGLEPVTPCASCKSATNCANGPGSG